MRRQGFLPLYAWTKRHSQRRLGSKSGPGRRDGAGRLSRKISFCLQKRAKGLFRFFLRNSISVISQRNIKSQHRKREQRSPKRDYSTKRRKQGKKHKEGHHNQTEKKRGFYRPMRVGLCAKLCAAVRRSDCPFDEGAKTAVKCTERKNPKSVCAYPTLKQSCFGIIRIPPRLNRGRGKPRSCFLLGEMGAERDCILKKGAFHSQSLTALPGLREHPPA